VQRDRRRRDRQPAHAPESRERTEQFFLLLKTPIGQEHVLGQGRLSRDCRE
jgi:hypothetical protein